MSRSLAAALVLAASVTSATVAAAEPPSETPVAIPAYSVPPPAPPRPQKSRNVATALAIAGTLAPMLLIARVDTQNPSRLDDGLASAGGVLLVALPSAGAWYAGKPFTLGTGLRLAGVAGIGYLVYEADHGDHCCGLASPVATLGAMASLTLVGAGAIYDVAMAGREVDRWNDAHRFEVMPAPMPMGTNGYGVGLVGRF